MAGRSNWNAGILVPVYDFKKNHRGLKGDLWYGYKVDIKNKPNKLFLG
jgi:hypothetical protein